MSYSVRWLCNVCGWIGDDAELLRAPNPFNPKDEVCGCPKCRAVNDLANACGTPGCVREASCGFPVPGGYRRTCYEHLPANAAPDQADSGRNGE
jgi:hypothetical protein